MPLSDLKSKYSKKDLKFGPSIEKVKQEMSVYYETRRHEPNNNFLYGFLCLIYDGANTLEAIKSKMRLFFISTTRIPVIENEDVEEFLQIARRKKLVIINEDDKISLTNEGKNLVELSYHQILHTSHWMRILFSEKTVMIVTAFCLIILSILKIFTGLQLTSQGMLTEGFENLTDLIKIGIIAVIGFKFNKDRLASIIIILMVLFTGATMVWASIEALFNPTPIIPTIQAYIIGFVSIAMNAGLMYLKSIVGRSSGNLSLLSDSKDSELNVRLSIGVLIGLTFAILKYYFVDAIVGLVIAALIFIEGIKILRELVAKEEDFDITAIKVVADNIYNTRLTGYLLGNIRRKRITRSQVLKNFEQGLTLGRLYYEGFADFFYDELGPEIAEKHLDKLIEGKSIEILKEDLVITPKGMKILYKSKAKEYNSRANLIITGKKFNKHHLYWLIFVIIFILLIIFGNDINSWLTSL